MGNVFKDQRGLVVWHPGQASVLEGTGYLELPFEERLDLSLDL